MRLVKEKNKKYEKLVREVKPEVIKHLIKRYVRFTLD
jgi:hypothetical protein